MSERAETHVLIRTDGKSERGSHPVVRMPMRQWMLRMTRFAQRLLDDLDGLDWDDSIKGMQRNWIGRSEARSWDAVLRHGTHKCCALV